MAILASQTSSVGRPATNATGSPWGMRKSGPCHYLKPSQGSEARYNHTEALVHLLP